MNSMNFKIFIYLQRYSLFKIQEIPQKKVNISSYFTKIENKSSASPLSSTTKQVMSSYYEALDESTLN